ncbi:uncharacterized protein [Periplaneta americana]|uniref:uncharacterized protein n=1 Tax=Periplaneta americana TaxID=6978 RepID=UPI0037E9276B
MLQVQLCCPEIENRFPFAASGKIMQTEAELPPVPDPAPPLEEEGPALTRVAMTVKEEVEDSPGEVDDFSPASQQLEESPLSVATSPQEESDRQHRADKGRGKGRRRSRWKLKFHHQALPPEYLDHYEASMAQQEGGKQNQSAKAETDAIATPVVLNTIPLVGAGEAEVVTRLDDEVSIITERKGKGLLGCLLSDAKSAAPPQSTPADGSKRRSSVIMSATPSTSQQQHKVMKYQDLPYMGEITLDNMKPRRGRKPKKADICHLIYKNYGTIFPGAPEPMPVENKQRVTDVASKSTPGIKCRAIESLRGEGPQQINHADVQNRIISSLLEKRLTQQKPAGFQDFSAWGKRPAPAPPPAPAPIPAPPSPSPCNDEPLNLCVKDLNQLKIRLLRKHGNFYEPRSSAPSVVTPTPTPAVKNEPDLEELLESSPATVPPPTVAGLAFPPAELQAPGGYVYWPGAGVFVHPMALYYQKLGAIPLVSVDQSQAFIPAAPLPAPPPPPTPTPKPPEPQPKSLAPKILPPELTFPRMKRLAPLGNPPPANAKRKRSAIFIPPLPSENNANPTTEVSICKFKFTGGAKPSLQEKKMLSVDSGGNFRYYSGTGDKSMRGYEFFPREALQGGAPPEHFPADKPPPAPPTPSAEPPPLALPPPEVDGAPFDRQKEGSERFRRKRKTRKSLAREKLEQTFKEKGFLIQTQQLESAEGATYCKFRQLRKFTRYLFRSWKDYLPGNVREMSVAAGVAGPGDSELEGEELSSSPPTPEQRPPTA